MATIKKQALVDGDEDDGTFGQDRESYSDTQDRDGYAVLDGTAQVRIVIEVEGGVVQCVYASGPDVDVSVINYDASEEEEEEEVNEGEAQLQADVAAGLLVEVPF